MTQNKIFGPVMIPDKKLTRYHDELGFYDAVFSAENIEKFRNSFHENSLESMINLQHEPEKYHGTKMTDSFLLDDNRRKLLPKNFIDLPNGTWMIEFTFDNQITYSEFERLNLRGFSIEVEFTVLNEDGKRIFVRENFRIMNKLSDLLPFNIYVQGGSTGGAGRNEHGAAHFELKERNSGYPIGKIEMPSLVQWEKLDFKGRLNLLKVINGQDITRKDKKAMARWLELNDNENLKQCHEEWNECNKFNNQAILI